MKTRKAEIRNNQQVAGYLAKGADGYSFAYDDLYLMDPKAPPISVTLPKTRKVHRSDRLFPFFYGLLAEGEDKALQCRTLRISEKDHFMRLLQTAHSETIGAITVREVPTDG